MLASNLFLLDWQHAWIQQDRLREAESVRLAALARAYKAAQQNKKEVK
ncbi:MAG: hypothetical protein JO352_00300 [Chloroflexi bacterium]|nr:hypothetical protein [Chloroflexota bacterium]MBV9597586.1 hypothetical protein [Chloroflexota bacterium]